MYKARQKAEWDEHARITTATEIGEQKGAEKKAVDIAKNLLAKGMDCKAIAEITGLTEEEIKKP